MIRLIQDGNLNGGKMVENISTIDDVLKQFEKEKAEIIKNSEWNLNKLQEKTNKLQETKLLLAQRVLTTEEYVAIAQTLSNRYGSSCFYLFGDEYDPTKSICENCSGDHGATQFDCEMCSNFSSPPEFYKTVGKLMFKPK